MRHFFFALYATLIPPTSTALVLLPKTSVLFSFGFRFGSDFETSSALALFSSSPTSSSKSERETDAPHHPTVTGVTLKIALDANGGAADTSASASERFTCPASLDLVHRLRCDCDAVLIGRTTVQADNPSLTVRRVECNNPQPLRVILDPKLTLVQDEIVNEDYALFRDGLPTVVYHCESGVDDSLLDLEESVTCVYLPSKDGKDDALCLEEVLQNLSERFQARHVMVEGGPKTASNFLRLRLVDRAMIIKAPMCFQEPLASGISDTLLQDAGLVRIGTEPCDVDQVEYWSRPNLPWPTQSLTDWP